MGDSPFTKTFKTSRKVNIWATISKPTNDPHRETVRRLISLGDGTNGKAHTLYGNIAATLIFETMGIPLLL